ncbi:hypothetical protein Tco_0892372 [Tanacetum coccineum]|uniref:Uncharacterized protein n=1 Tax=Tanacetum coccineum TaxID=301880 RepID=A0ABQ5C5P5_9ASTR
MALSIADQIALDDALVAPADRLKIGKCNLRLSSDVTSKEATLQVVYDVLKLTPFYKAFQVTADAPEIYMQEFWASAYVHNRSVRFKMNNKKHIIGLEQFRDILQICPKVGNKKFVEPPLEKEILIFLASLGHSGDIRKITDVNVNKLHQPWRSFAAVINKCLSGTPSYDSLRLSQAQILWGNNLSKTKGSKKKANTDSITKLKPPTAPKEKKSGKGKQKTTEWKHDVDEKAQDDDDEEQTESDDDDDEDSDNEVEGTNVEGTKSDEEATYEEESRNEAVEYQTDLMEGEDVMTIYNRTPCFKQPGKLKTLMEPKTQHRISIDTPVTAIMEASFTCTEINLLSNTGILFVIQT